MAYEPWYQTTSPSKTDVLNSVNGEWFMTSLSKKKNTYADNVKLRTETKCNVTYEVIRMSRDWRQQCDEIIKQEVDKECAKGVGSYRGYWTFVHASLCARIRERVVVEIVAKNKLNKKLGRLTIKWIEKRYAPGGKGFQQALTSFQSLSAKTS